MYQFRPPSWKEKLWRSGYFLGALLFHFVIFLMVATFVIFRAPLTPAETEFQAVHIASSPPPPQPPPAAGAAANVAQEPQSNFVPPTAPVALISTSQAASFQVAATEAVANAISHMSLPAPQSSGLTRGGGSAGSGSGSSSEGGFFGLQTQGKRIAYLLDYSGSMEGAFRLRMESELEKSLTKLPEGTQVIVICWAGPAWIYSQTAPQIARNWKSLGAYDNFATIPPFQLEPPTWVNVNSGSVAEIIKGIKAQVSDQGGTDWRQPFRYAMLADPPPDTVFFLTDGQLPAATADRAFEAISVAISKANAAPQINCLWIENPTYKSDPLEKFAQKYNGEFRRVSGKVDGP